ncbi:MAG: hypothetical protein A2V90_07900 [Gammaproteobacteria bacterium RBG_16_57_12]|nr:MAG: hypothetical protein A2V90_07900 [Gammaproteobacteria bacterium RBG_16_57_12]
MTIILVVFSLILWAPADAFARLMEAEGSADIINGDVRSARDQAIIQATRAALLQAATRVQATSVVSSHELIADSVRINAAGVVKDVVVLEESVENRVVKVRIRAQVMEDKLQLLSPAASYRKKIAVTQFQVMERGQIFDMPAIEQDLPRELLRRMENTGDILAVDGSQYAAEPGQPGSDKVPDVAARMTELAGSLGAQFIITGVIHDMGVNRHLMRNTRHLVLDVDVYDGISGALLSRRRINEAVKGAGHYAPAATFGSVDFLRSEYGRRLDGALDKLARGVIQDLHPLPFTARVIRNEGDEVFFNAGTMAKVKVGDVLMTYQLAPMPLTGDGGRFLGYEETPVAALVVKRVQPLFAVGELRDSVTPLKAGDMVRFGL